MSKPQVKAESPTGVSTVLQRLSQTKQFQQLHTVLKSIYQSEAVASEDGAQSMKDHFKLILLSLGTQ